MNNLCKLKEKKLQKNLVSKKKCCTFVPGEMAEWSIAAVLKTVELRGSGGSNPSLSAKERKKHHIAWCFFYFALKHRATDILSLFLYSEQSVEMYFTHRSLYKNGLCPPDVFSGKRDYLLKYGGCGAKYIYIHKVPRFGFAVRISLWQGPAASARERARGSTRQRV